MSYADCCGYLIYILPTGTTTVEYVPSSAWENDYLPFNIQTVEKITTSDNEGTSASATYTYSGGKYEPISREIRGFKKVTAVDDLCLYVHDPDPSEDSQDPLDCQHMPIAREDFAKMTVFGSDRLRTAVILEKAG